MSPMRRAAIQALRAARRGHLKKLLAVRSSPHLHPALLKHQSLLRRQDVPLYMVHSSLYFRSFSVAALVSVLASGIWFYQRDQAIEPRVLTENPTNAGPNNLYFVTPLSNSISTDVSSSTSDAPAMPTVGQALSAQKPLSVADEDFFLAELAEEKALTKSVDDEGTARMEKLSPEQATQRLRKSEKSFSIGRGQGVTRYDLVQIPSNNPIEDDHAERIVEMPQSVAWTHDGKSSSDWMFWGVFDGHSGWTTSAKLRQTLIPYVARELNTAYRTANLDPALKLPTPQTIDAAIKRGFVRLDNDIVHTSVQKVFSNKTKQRSTELLAPALSGSCALLSFYDTSSRLFRVACTGDSRAVLGRKGASGKWTATQLSEDQTGGTPSEVARLRTEHPGEPEVTLNGRILGGLEPSRAFGDASYKWTKDLQEKIRKQFYGRSPAMRLKSPPYVTAEPVVTTTKIEPEKGDFVVLATDGLWEMLTNEEVVGLVGRWLERRQSSGSSGALSWAKAFAGQSDKSLPVERQIAVKGRGEEGQRAPIRQQQWSVTEKDERFVVEDQNVATHLVRNALGGRDRDMVCSLLSLVSPYARRYRDDLTVQVIFFGEGKGSGEIETNHEASNPGLGARPKL